jgi:hypothetical protein
MGMKRDITITIPAVVAAALLIAACGSSDESSTSDGGLRAPTPIEISSNGADSSRVATAAADQPAAEGALAADDMMIAPWFDVEYVLGDGLVAPTADTGYVFDASVELTAEQVSDLAESLEVTGEPTRIDEGYGVSWRVGPDDGTEPSLWAYDDAMQSWNYSSAWADQETSGRECAVSVDSDGNETYDCPEPEPPVGVPTADEAEELASDILERLGVDTTTVEFDTYADEWFASVTASSTTEARTVFTSWGFGFGAEGVLQYASGSLATPQMVGPYPLVDLDTAFQRLQDQSSGGIGGGPLIADTAIAAEGDMAVSEIDVAEPMPAEPVPAEEVPVEGSIPEPETIVVTLVDVEADLWWVWDVDGNTWLLPAYRFIGDDGGWYVVPAVTDEFLIEVDPPVGTDGPTPEPGIVEPGIVDSGTGGGSGAVDPDEGGVIDPEFGDAEAIEAELRAVFEGSLPLVLSEFADQAEALGFETRVVIEDGEALPATLDFRLDRVNVEVVDGQVVMIDSVG